MTKTTGSPRRLDPEALVHSALTIADNEGIEAVTIRRLAQQHQVTPMALYRHFRDKDQLLHAVSERILASVEMPAPTDDPWDEQLRALFTAILTALRPHPAVATLMVRRFLTTDSGLALSERALGLLDDGGFPVDLAANFGVQAVCALVNLVATEPGMDEMRLDAEEREDTLRVKRARLAALSPRRYPHIVAAADALTWALDRDNYYDNGIELIVAGLRGVATIPGVAARDA